MAQEASEGAPATSAEKLKKRGLLSFSSGELEAFVTARGGKPFHARAARRWVLSGEALEYNNMTDLPAALAERLSQESTPVEASVAARRDAPDKTVKLLLTLADRQQIETVWMPGSKGTVCVSTQVGCAMACRFCASGLAGVVRNLQMHEILEQVVHARRVAPFGRIVVMGIGEPLLNLDPLLSALEVVTDPKGMGISPRRITISTVGLPDRIRELIKVDKPFTLAISLHAPDDALRHELIPAARKIHISSLVEAASEYFHATGREVTFEYVLLANVNDRPAQARALSSLLRGARATVNLIPYNPVTESPYRRPDDSSIVAFRDALARGGIVATVRWSTGVLADAACGQLRIGAQPKRIA